MNDFIVIHAYSTSCEYLPTMIRINDIKSVETRTGGNNYRVIFMKDGTHYDVKETVEERFNKIKENGK